ncbi:MAG: hypothetical protein ACWGQW_11375, partial [bacterium]
TEPTTTTSTTSTSTTVPETTTTVQPTTTTTDPAVTVTSISVTELSELAYTGRTHNVLGLVGAGLLIVGALMLALAARRFPIAD